MLYNATRRERKLLGPQVERDSETDRAGAVKREELVLTTWDTLKNWTAPLVLHHSWSLFRLGSSQASHEDNRFLISKIPLLLKMETIHIGSPISSQV